MRRRRAIECRYGRGLRLPLTLTLVAWRRGIPPSVLPDISPTRGEIGWEQRPGFHDCSRAGASLFGEALRHLPISPPVGEMSGRTEGVPSPPYAAYCGAAAG
ncbi:hypothetical protein GFL85_28395 [Rhizobium laguerreae]|nr:hypothetical protein [Rhizobium laguerreae]NKM20103.1 hypothetical protein [Rhizobium laguerreae]